MVDRIDPNDTWDLVGEAEEEDGEDYASIWDQIAEMPDISPDTLSLIAAVRRARDAS